MILDATTDSLEIILDKAKTTNDLSFAVFFNEYDATSVTPKSNYDTTNGISAKNLIASPASGKQRQLRYCAINNVDTKDIGVKIRFNANGSYRNLLYVFLRVNESIQYSEEMGWRIYTVNGEEKTTGYNRLPSSMRMPEWFGAANITTTLTLTNGTAYVVYIGKAERPYSSVKIQYKTTTALAGAGAWGEIGIYKGSPTLQTNTALTRLGYADVTTTLTATAGVKTSTVTTSDMAIGDDLYAAIASSGTTATVIRAGLAADNLGVGFFQTLANTRPSTSATFTPTIDTTTAMPFIAWQGVYQGT